MGKEWNKYLKLKKERPDLFTNSGPIKIVSDKKIIKKFERSRKKKIGVVYESEYHTMVVDLVYEEEGKYFTYERLLYGPESGAVVCVPMYQKNFVLLKQYRHAIRDTQYAFPRGFGSAGVSAEENARKEIQEELGATVLKSQYIGEIVADSGLSGGAVSVYLCEIDRPSTLQGYEGIEAVEVISEETLKEMICSGKITDGYTLGAFAYLAVKGSLM